MFEVGRRLAGPAEWLGEEAEEGFAIGVAREGRLAVVAALGEPVSGRGEAISAGQGWFWCLRVFVGFGGEKSVLVTAGQAGWQALVSYFVWRKVAGNACGAVSAEVKLLVLMEIGEKSGIHVDGTDSWGFGPRVLGGRACRTAASRS